MKKKVGLEAVELVPTETSPEMYRNTIQKKKDRFLDKRKHDEVSAI